MTSMSSGLYALVAALFWAIVSGALSFALLRRVRNGVHYGIAILVFVVIFFGDALSPYVLHLW